MKSRPNLIEQAAGNTPMIGGFLLLSIFFLIVSCGTSRNTGRTMDIENYDQLSAVVNAREFAIQNSWAMPLGGNQIDLIGNTNFIRFEGDSVDLFLPYFGVRHSGGTYGSGEGGVEYEGPLRSFNSVENQDKNIILKFEGEQDNEILEFTVTLYPNGRTHTFINSSQRNTISYRGRLKELPEDQ